MVASSSAVLPEPGNDMRLITSIRWAQYCPNVASLLFDPVVEHAFARNQHLQLAGEG